MSRKNWKPRLQDMKEAVSKIQEYSKNIQSVSEFSKDRKTLDACVRNFQVLGEASNKIPAEVRKIFSDIPWKEIKGMRNVLIHEYFGTDASIIWNTIKNELPKLEDQIDKLIKKYDEAGHEWKICPIGEYFVRSSHVDSYVTSSGKNVKAHLRRDHCREYSHHHNANILSLSEIKAITDLFIMKEFSSVRLKDLGFGKAGTQYDSRIAGWTKYWNETLKPKMLLDPNFVKVLIASESSFNPDANRNHKGKRSVGLGIGQLMPLTVKALMGFKKEIKDHLIDIDGIEVFDPDINLAASIRWIFQKKKLADSKLKRDATWLEAVENYKNVLERKKDSKVYRENMDPFLKMLKKMEIEK